MQLPCWTRPQRDLLILILHINKENQANAGTYGAAIMSSTTDLSCSEPAPLHSRCSFPPTKLLKVGTARMPAASAVDPLSSTSIFTNVTLSPFSFARFANTGAMARQGPHLQGGNVRSSDARSARSG
jgi:hypothetical protein